MMDREIQGRTEAQTWVLEVIMRMPLASAGDLAQFERLSQSRCGQILNGLHRQGLVVSVRVGATRPVQNRWFLTRAGIRKVVPKHRGMVPWPLGESGLKSLLRRLPMLEQVYMLAPGFLKDPEVTAPHRMILPQDPDEWVEPPTHTDLIGFEWLRSSTIHAVARYHEQIIVPWVWIGLWGPSPAWKEYEEGKHTLGLRYYDPHMYAGWNGPPHLTQPSAWALVGVDTWALERGSLALPQGAPKTYCIDGQRYGPLHLEASVLEVYDQKPYGPMGIPERIVTWVKKDPVMAALNGTVPFKAAKFVEEWPAAKAVDIASWCGQPPSKMRKVLRRLVEAHVVSTFDGHSYLGEEGIKAAARRDRVSSNTVRKRLGKFIGESDHSRKQYRVHDRKMAQMAIFWLRCGLDCAGGWRGEVVVPGTVTLAPDARLYMAGNGEKQGWYFVEYERSATAPSQVIHKLEGYRTFADVNIMIPLMVVCDRKDAEEVFWDVGGDLDLVTTTYDTVMKGDSLLHRLMYRGTDGPLLVLGPLEEARGDGADEEEVTVPAEMADQGEVVVDVPSGDPRDEDPGSFYEDELIWDEEPWDADEFIYDEPADTPEPPWGKKGFYDWMFERDRSRNRPG